MRRTTPLDTILIQDGTISPEQAQEIVVKLAVYVNAADLPDLTRVFKGLLAFSCFVAENPELGFAIARGLRESAMHVARADFGTARSVEALAAGVQEIVRWVLDASTPTEENGTDVPVPFTTERGQGPPM